MKPDTQSVTKATIVRKTVLSFAVFLILLGLGWWALRAIAGAKKDDGVQAPLRAVLSANQHLFGSTMSRTTLAKTYPVSKAAKNVRVNGKIGMSAAFEPEGWRLKVARAPGDTLVLSLEDIKRLPKTEIVFDFKCIEGWDQITHWGGVKMEDFIKAYHLEGQAGKAYLGLQTPDGGYYVGIDMPSALHPQTLLAYEMNAQPLPLDQGAPLRLIIPVKYGIKHLKRIGTIYFSDKQPRDYWAEQGYDYYAGH
jgi:DMSO/TMAO reductase YedYZ molybdopterin-dependent catalytic subunit